MEFENAWNKARKLVLVLLILGFGLSGSIAVAQGDTSNSGFELDYYHAYHAKRTYAIRLRNGLRATFDFRHGTATLYANGQQSTMPLDQVLLQAANGNSHLATQMYNQMYQDITATHSDAIMKYVGSSGASNNSLHAFLAPPVTIDPGQGANDAMWSTPDIGDCDPVSEPCQESGPMAPFDPYHSWQNVPVGTPPFTDQPPSLDNCAPGDIDCKIWENNRKNACDQLIEDGIANGTAGYVAGDACIAAVGTVGTLTPACGAGFIVYVLSAIKLSKDMYTCNEPYPGP